MGKILLFFLFSKMLFAIIVISPVEPGHDHGLSGEVDFTFKASFGNTETENNDFGAKLQYDNNETLYVNYLIYNFREGTANGIQNIKSQFAHYRFVKQLSNITATEVYLQAEEDAFKNLNLRQLAGAGMRYRFSSSKKHQFYFGFGAYYSEEFYNTTIIGDTSRHIPRLNSYIAYKENFDDQFIASLTLYYQPSLKKLLDTNVIADTSLTYNLTTQLALKISGSYRKDTDPALGNKKEDSFYATSLSYTF